VTPETLLAFDFGEKRIGVAIGNSLTREARALTILTPTSATERLERIAALVQTWQPERLVVGIARASDGSTHLMTRRCERFANQLQGRFGLPIERVDERFSSVEAETLRRDLRRAGRLKASAGIDDLAAQIILQSYFEARDAKPA
jgi:putative Holliday junction resolvase